MIPDWNSCSCIAICPVLPVLTFFVGGFLFKRIRQNRGRKVFLRMSTGQLRLIVICPDGTCTIQWLCLHGRGSDSELLVELAFMASCDTVDGCEILRLNDSAAFKCQEPLWFHSHGFTSLDDRNHPQYEVLRLFSSSFFSLKLWVEKSISHHRRSSKEPIPQRNYQQTLWFPIWFYFDGGMDFATIHSTVDGPFSVLLT